ncbi:PACE efflux transporter [Cribrihabitans neustonicus]|uniref:PACE efflux transporter n=1 Tax=Cribrihabitans neustonicus TaxID=1429085 RepID=UPI003B5C04AF
MRSARDRIRHAISFEVIGLLLITPLGAWVFGIPAAHLGAAAFICASIATAWNFLYNLLFDKALVALRGSTGRGVALRVLHAVLFELGLLLVLMPFLAWFLEISLFQAFVMDAGFAGFYLVYAFAFNWAYDMIFPVPARPSGPGGAAAQAG